MSGSGSHRQTYLPGCESNGETFTGNSTSCSTELSPAYFNRITVMVTLLVDKHQNHQLQITGPGADYDATCPIPSDWETSMWGPRTVVNNAPLISDATLAAGAPFTVKVGHKESVECVDLSAFLHNKCTETLEWSGEVLFRPVTPPNYLDFGNTPPPSPDAPIQSPPAAAPAAERSSGHNAGIELFEVSSG